MQLQEKKPVRQSTNALRPTSFTKLRFLAALTMSIKSIEVQLKLRLRKDIATNLLNKRSELVGKCRHQNKLLLCNLKRNDSID